MVDSCFGQAVRHYRKRKGWTVGKLEVESGVSSSSIERYEQGRVSPRLEHARSLARALGATLDEMVEFDSATMSSDKGRYLKSPRIRRSAAA